VLAAGHSPTEANPGGRSTIFELDPEEGQNLKTHSMVSKRPRELLFLLAGSVFLALTGARIAAAQTCGFCNGNNAAGGGFALKNLTSGVENSAFGDDALFSNTTGSDNNRGRHRRARSQRQQHPEYRESALDALEE